MASLKILIPSNEKTVQSPALLKAAAVTPIFPPDTFSLGEIERQLCLVQPLESRPKAMTAHFYRTHTNVAKTAASWPRAPARPIRPLRRPNLIVDTGAGIPVKKLSRCATKFIPETTSASVKKMEKAAEKVDKEMKVVKIGAVGKWDWECGFCGSECFCKDLAE